MAANDDDAVLTGPEAPEGLPPGGGPDRPPPQLIRTVNLLPVPEHDIGGPDEVERIADFLAARAREGLDDLFAHEDYAGFDGPTEAWARAVAEHQTGIPYTMPVYFYDGPQAKIASAIVDKGRYPLVGQCQQSVTTALCLGGWDGGTHGDIGSGIDAQPSCRTLGKGWNEVPFTLASWPDDLWDEVQVGSCLFWSAPCPLTKDGKTCSGNQHVPGCGRGSGHVVMVLRKHPTERQWQLWDTTTSYADPVVHPAAARGARMLWESHWWAWIPKALSNGWAFRGIASIHGLGTVRDSLAPRGRCRLLLRRRSDHQLLYRGEWLSMESEGLPISWLLRSLRGAPFADRIEAMWCVDSVRDAAGANQSRPLLDVISDPRGTARLSWRPVQGGHDRANPGDWKPEATFLIAPSDAASASSAEEGDDEGGLRCDPLRGQRALEQVVAGKGTLRRGASGPAVKALQEALLTLGIEVRGGADGSFGASLTTSVTAFQTRGGIPANGLVDAATLQALDAELASQADKA